MSKTKVVLYWPETEEASIMDLSVVREEDRFVGAPTVIKLGNKYHQAIVRFISSDGLKVQEAEDALLEEIDAAVSKKEKEMAQNKTRRSRHRKPQLQEGAASSNQVASALGERLKPTPVQAVKTKELAEAKRAATKAQNDAQDAIDRQTQSFKKNLFSLNEDLDTQGFDDDQQSEDGIELLDSEVVENPSAKQPKPNDQNCCSHCKDLRKAYNQSGTLFVQALATFVHEDSYIVQYAELLPIPEDIPTCELSKNQNPKVYISIGDKASIKINGEGDPAKMVRLTLACLFGRQTLEQHSVTALGTKPGTLGITKNVRDAIRNFANRNKGSSYKDLTEAMFNNVINRLKCQIHRKNTPNEKQKGTKNYTPVSKVVASPKPGPSKVVASPSKSVWVVNEHTPPPAFKPTRGASASPLESVWPAGGLQSQGPNWVHVQRQQQQIQQHHPQQHHPHQQQAFDYHSVSQQQGHALAYQNCGYPYYPPHPQPYIPEGPQQYDKAQQGSTTITQLN